MRCTSARLSLSSARTAGASVTSHGAAARRSSVVDFSDPDAGLVVVDLESPDASIILSFDYSTADSPAAVAQVHPRAERTPRCQVSSYAIPWATPPASAAGRSNLELFLFWASRPLNAEVRVFPMVRLPPDELWTPRVESFLRFDVPFSVDGGSARLSVNHYTLKDLSDDSNPATVTPLVFSPTNLALDGQSAMASTPVVTDSLTPVLSWSPPTAGLPPTAYLVSVSEVSSQADAGLSFTRAVIIGTSDTRVRVVPGALKRGATYVMVVYAMISGPPASEPHPSLASHSYEHAPAVSEIWRVAP